MSIWYHGSEDYRYTGKPEDPTGLYYYGARYYNSEFGRFITRDTVFGDLSDPQSLNRYVYCENNPEKYIDPTGNWLDTAIDVAGLIYDAHEYRENPNFWTGAAVAVDVVFLIVPFIPNLTVLKHANKIDDVADTVTHLDDVAKYADNAAEGFSDFMKWTDEYAEVGIKYEKHVVRQGEFGGPLVTSVPDYYEIAHSPWNSESNSIIMGGLPNGREAGWNFDYGSISFKQNGVWKSCFEPKTGFDYFLDQMTDANRLTWLYK